jgi:hypothetical protein
MTEWQPMDTAPKDGTEILLYGRCERDGQFFAADCNVGWWEETEDMWTTRELPIDPSHWMPLPARPASRSLKQQCIPEGKMDAEIKAKWVEALRSGKYEQGQNRLRRGDAFCCLGVLCDVVGGGEWERDQFVIERERGISYLPRPMRRWLDDSDAEEALVTMNDDGVPFTEIADYIDKRL